MDVKGRMAFPAKLREIIGDNFIVTKGVGGCLFVYSTEDFAAKAEKLKALPMAQGLPLQRSFMANATEVEADKQGRILVPMILREIAALEKEIIVVGVSDHCEIWNPDRWEELNKSVTDEMLMAALEGANF
jgi:MraZ protein